MAYSDLLLETGIRQDFLTVLKIKKRLTGWTLHSGFIYVVDFDLSDKTKMFVDGVEMTAVSSIAAIVTASQFFHDTTNNKIYLRTPASSDPDTEIAVAKYELYFATSDSYAHRIPTDSSEDIVFFEGLIDQPPIIKQTMSDSLIGFLPVQSGRFSLANGDHILEKHLYDTSFNKSEVEIYHALRTRQIDNTQQSLETTNIKRVFRGFTNNVLYSDDMVNIETFSRVDDFDVEYRHTSGDNFFSTATFPSLDTNFSGKPIRAVYGRVDGFIPVNIDFVDADTATTSDNRDWVVQHDEGAGLNNIQRTVPASPSSTTTRTYVGNATGFRVGDLVEIDKTTNEYREVTNVDYTDDFIEHSALVSGAATSGDLVNRLWVARVEIEQDNVRYKAFPNRDYTTATFAGTTAGFSFNTSLETNISLPNTLTPNDRVFVTVYGKLNDVTIGGPPFGSDDSQLGNLTDPIVILFDLLANKLGLGESAFDTTVFQSVQSSVSDKVSFAIPEQSTDNFPTHKDLLNKMIQTILFRFFLTQEDKWSLDLIEPGVSGSDTITDDEINERGIRSTFNFKDIVSDVRVLYRFREAGTVAGDRSTESLTATAESEVAKFLHDVEKTKEFPSFHLEAADAQTLADHLSFIFGDRQGRIIINTNDNQFFDNLISDESTISRAALPGFDFDSDTLRSRDAVLVETTKGLREIELVFDDVKGIEDNSSSW